MLIYRYPNLSKINCPMKGSCTIATTNIPANTIIAKEFAFRPDDKYLNEKNHYNIAFILVKKALKIYPEKFLSLIPDELDENSIHYDKIKSAHLLYLPSLDKNTAILYATKFFRNAFRFAGSACFLFDSSQYNHSCNPNIVFYQNEDHMIFRATRDIKAGEEITERYGNDIMNFKVRQEKLLHNYNFICECTRCRKEKLIL